MTSAISSTCPSAGPRTRGGAGIPQEAEFATKPEQAQAMIARALADPADIDYYACYGPSRTGTARLARIAGGRWHIAECLQLAKGEAGLDQYQVRTRRAWHAHITLSMLALAWLAASKAQDEKRGPPPATPA